jgi:cobalt/nickel transport protein
MKQLIIGGILLTAIALVVSSGVLKPEAKYPGVDEAVVAHFAEKAGRPAWEPFINTGQGDVALFFFLCAGILGGFVAGYHYRELFPPRKTEVADPADV